MAAPKLDLSDAELVDFRIEGKEPMVRIRVEEGATLELRWMITNVYRKGNDPATGVPVYILQSSSPIMRLVNYDKKLRKAALKQPGPDEGSASVGVR